MAVAVNAEGKREIVGLHIRPSEAVIFWSTFFKSLARRGLRGLERQRRSRVVISAAHDDLKAAIRRVMAATWQSYKAH